LFCFDFEKSVDLRLFFTFFLNFISRTRRSISIVDLPYLELHGEQGIKNLYVTNVIMLNLFKTLL